MIIRVNKQENPFAQIDKGVLQNTALSYKARGIAAYLLSHGEAWEVRLTDLVNNSPDGIKAVRSGMKELKQQGYARLVPIFDDNKQLKGKSWEFSETPIYSKNTDMTISATSPKSDRRKTGTTNNIDIPKGIVEQVIERLNLVADRDFKHTTKSTQRHINARYKEKFTIEDFFAVIDYKVNEWGNDPKMKDYLRPETLFGTKFESYLQAAKNTNVGSNTDDKLNNYELSEEREKEYQIYYQWVLEHVPELLKSNCQILTKRDWLDYREHETIPMMEVHLTPGERRSILTKAHTFMTAHKWAREKYGSVWELYLAEARTIIHRTKPIIRHAA